MSGELTVQAAPPGPWLAREVPPSSYRVVAGLEPSPEKQSTLLSVSQQIYTIEVNMYIQYTYMSKHIHTYIRMWNVCMIRMLFTALMNRMIGIKINRNVQ